MARANVARKPGRGVRNKQVEPEQDSPPLSQRVSVDPRVFAPILAHLFTDMRAWVLRRVERFEFLDDTGVRRRTSVDFDVTCSVLWNDWQRAVEPRQIAYVPVALLAKWPLTSFSLWDATGRRRSVLQRGPYREYVAAMVHHMLEHAGVDEGILESLQGDIEDLVAENWEKSEKAWLNIKRPLLALAQESGKQEERIRFNVDTMLYLGAQLARSFLLLVPLDPGELPRGILKYEYRSPVPWGKRGFPVFKRIGWEDHEFKFSVPSVGHAASYHAECTAPEGLDLRGLRLTLELSQGGATDLTEVRARKRTIHINTAGQHRFGPYKLFVRLGPERRGAVRASYWGSWAASIGTLITFLRVPVLSQPGSGNIEASAVVPVLLAIPALTVVYVNRVSENGVTERFMLGLRTLVALYAGASLLSAVCYAVALRGAPLILISAFAAILSIVCTGILRRTMRQSRTRVTPERYVGDAKVRYPFDEE